jgi:hypothetical protein
MDSILKTPICRIRIRIFANTCEWFISDQWNDISFIISLILRFIHGTASFKMIDSRSILVKVA